jgi:hypothetical protein
MDTLDIANAEAVRLKRDSLKHVWTMAVGAHWIALPWADTADAVTVVTWIKGRTDGRVKISIDL